MSDVWVDTNSVMECTVRSDLGNFWRITHCVYKRGWIGEGFRWCLQLMSLVALVWKRATHKALFIPARSTLVSIIAW